MHGPELNICIDVDKYEWEVRILCLFLLEGSWRALAWGEDCAQSPKGKLLPRTCAHTFLWGMWKTCHLEGWGFYVTLHGLRVSWYWGKCKRDLTSASRERSARMWPWPWWTVAPSQVWQERESSQGARPLVSKRKPLTAPWHPKVMWVERCSSAPSCFIRL